MASNWSGSCSTMWLNIDGAGGLSTRRLNVFVGRTCRVENRTVGFDTKRINRGEAYSDGNACTTMAKNYFSRLRRAEIGTHHKIAGPHLAAY